MDNRIGIYYAFWEQEWDADYFKYIDKVSKLGFDVLELAAGPLPSMGSAVRKDLAKAAADAGIELTYCIGMTAEHDMASEDPAVRRAGIRFATELLEDIREMGGKVIGGIIYSCWPSTLTEGIVDKRPWWDRSVASIREVSKVAEDCGVTYCLEVVNRFEQFLLNTAAEGCRFVDEVGSGSVKLLLDAFHMNIEEDSFRDAILATGDKLGHFHIGETNRRVPGRGKMPWDEIVGALRDIRYGGRIVMEPFLRMGGAVGRDIKMWRDLTEQPGEEWMDREAAFALDFMRGKLGQK